MSLWMALVGGPIGWSSRANADHYSEHVKPLLAEKCVACHGPLRSEAGLRLDAAALIRRGADGSPVVVDGKPAESALFERVSTREIDQRMPPEGEGVALTKAELAVVEKWIAEGMPAPQDETYVASPMDHWAYQPIVVPEIPPPPADAGEQADAGVIDRLLGHLQRQRGLERLPAADRETWLRRVTLDLSGLPPTPEEIADYLSNTSPDAEARIVERLLARPAYGERWGRHWMDVWRYSDWDGYKQELRGSQRHIWHWRDWIIESLNDDKPYDQMVLEMLAGDEIAPTDENVLRATGFLARNFHKSNRNIWLDATVEHTAKAFLGMTLACARCHDHKYDPISQEQYYQFRAIFEPHEVRTEPIEGQPDLTKAGIPRAFDAKPDAKTFLLNRGNEKQPREDSPLQPGVPLGFDLPLECTPVPLPPVAYQPSLAPAAQANAMDAAWQRLETAWQEAQPKLKQLRAQANSAAAQNASATAADAKEADAKEADALEPLEVALVDAHAAEAALVALEARYAADHAKADGATADRLTPLVRKAAQAEQRANLLAAKAGYAAAIRSLEAARTAQSAANSAKADPAKSKAKADPAKAKVDAKKAADALAAAEKNLQTQREAWRKAQAAAQTEATAYTPVGPVYPRESTGRRLGLARWIIDPRNPLTARVAANHIWMRHFGAPLVDDVADFGLRAKQPVTAPLLDWLADQLLSSGWDMKRLHRQIVLSETYRLSSDTSCPEGQKAKSLDPENRLLARANVRRLDAEEIRDSLLAVAEHLDRSFGGPDLSEDEGEKLPRRSVYFRHAYEKQVPMLVLFDGPSPNECYRRSPSILPQQALALANSDLSRQLSQRLGARLHEQTESQAQSQASARADGQSTGFVERLFVAVLGRQPTDQERAACTDFLSESASDQSLLQRRQSLAHALLNHNDFVVAR